MELTTELGLVLPLVPAFIVAITESVKAYAPKRGIWIIPYIVSVLAFTGLWVVFNGESFGVYIVTSVIFAFGSAKAYDAATRNIKKKQVEEVQDSDESIHDVNSLSGG